MRLYVTLISILFLSISCQSENSKNRILVNNMDELRLAIADATAGTTIVLANGVWTDAQIKFYGHGNENSPIKLTVETPGEVTLEGQSYIHLGGEYLIVDGLYFKNGYSPEGGVIRFQIGKDSTAFHSQVTQSVIENFSRLNRWENDRWIEMYGQHNKFDHNYITGKSNDGATLMVYHKGNQHTNSYHQIEYNHFGPRPRKGGPRGETMRLGGSETSMTPGKVRVANNFFDRCNGEVEIISDKTNFNNFINNIFYKCEGSLVMRHSDYTTVDGNMFIGDDDSDFYGGIRVINTGHWITNNYFYKIRGAEFRSPLAVMNGIPKSSLNRYKQVTDVVVAYNTWVDCSSPFQIGVGQNKASKDVLPKSEIRSAPPIRTVLANNIIYNTQVDPAIVVNHDDISGIQFENNALFNAGDATDHNGIFSHVSIEMNPINEWLLVPSSNNPKLENAYDGFGFNRIEKDLLGNNRAAKNRIGAIADPTQAEQFQLDSSVYGPSWFTAAGEKATPEVHQAIAGDDSLQAIINKAADGDVIELAEGNYNFSNSLKIDKAVTLKGKAEGKVHLNYKGATGTPAFEMNPMGRLSLEGVQLKGDGSQMAFAPLKKNMSAAYKLFVKGSLIENFDHILLASRGSFADSIGIDQTSFRNLKNGFVLAADQKGDYNAEMFSIKDSQFENIQQNVIHFFRGGYDESTIGGVLTLTNNRFSNCGKTEKSGILIKTRGIINVLLEENDFKNNPVKRVAVLWGAKNNSHVNNRLERSGSIEVQEQQALEILY